MDKGQKTILIAILIVVGVLLVGKSDLFAVYTKDNKECCYGSQKVDEHSYQNFYFWSDENQVCRSYLNKDSKFQLSRTDINKCNTYAITQQEYYQGNVLRTFKNCCTYRDEELAKWIKMWVNLSTECKDYFNTKTNSVLGSSSYPFCEGDAVNVETLDYINYVQPTTTTTIKITTTTQFNTQLGTTTSTTITTTTIQGQTTSTTQTTSQGQTTTTIKATTTTLSFITQDGKIRIGTWGAVSIGVVIAVIIIIIFIIVNRRKK